ncbi:gastrin-releasing peptide receptor-like [Periplaneta americana]|uniref:gastrin-releasing peptide receptor-like n=1 Tax=Periplaneta americana TaxID=6978 RepID=UPI0037E9134F
MNFSKIICLFALQLFLATDLIRLSAFAEVTHQSTLMDLEQTGSTTMSIIRKRSDAASRLNRFKVADSKNRKHLILNYLLSPDEESLETVLNASRDYHEDNFKCSKQQDNCTRKGLVEELENGINVTELINQFEKAAREYLKIHIDTNRTDELIARYSNSRTLSNIKPLTRSLRDLIQLQRSFLETVTSPTGEVLQEMTNELNLTHWQIDLNLKCQTLKHLENVEFKLLLHDYIQPALQGVLFIVGLLGNGALLLIFVRCGDMRTSPHMLLFSLTLADVLHLLINVPVFYTYFASVSWHKGEVLCKLYRFFRQLGIGVSVYSVVAMSIHKYVVLARFNDEKKLHHRITNSTTIFITSSVWIIGAMIALPYAVYAEIYGDKCYGFIRSLHINYLRGITIIGLIIICIIPVCLVWIFSFLSSKITGRSSKTLLEETMGVANSARSYIVSSNILIAVAIVSAISYIPFYSLEFYIEWIYGDTESRLYYCIYSLTYLLAYGNFCFNPIAIFIASRKFRESFQRSCFCQKSDMSDEHC